LPAKVPAGLSRSRRSTQARPRKLPPHRPLRRQSPGRYPRTKHLRQRQMHNHHLCFFERNDFGSGLARGLFIPGLRFIDIGAGQLTSRFLKLSGGCRRCRRSSVSIAVHSAANARARLWTIRARLLAHGKRIEASCWFGCGTELRRPSSITVRALLASSATRLGTTY
jgi:hypothetical protein